MKYLGSITNGKDLTTKEYVDDKTEVVQTLTSGTKIGSVGGTDLYAPSGGGTADYDQLSNRPQVNSNLLTGNKSLSDLGLAGEVLDTFYPVGSYYETSDTTFNPNTAWGGTWVLETAGRFHLSAGTGYAAGSTGGSADAIVPSHKHSVAKVTGAITGGAHTHDIKNRSVYGGSSNYMALYKGGTGTSTNAALSETHTHDLPAHNTDYEGTSGTGANMPPYIAVNRWHRTA